jgi:carbamate kinase
MGPKVESALRFLHAGGHEVIITSYEHLYDAIHGAAGTRVVSDAQKEIRSGSKHEHAMQ